jgi:hypothetical protein
MPGAINIAPLFETVDIRGRKLRIKGLEAETIIGLYAQFDDLRRMLDTRKFDALSLAKLSVPAAAYVIAACIDDLDEKNAANLSLGERVEILVKILKISMGRGIGPFVEMLELFAAAVQSSLQPDMGSSNKSKNSSRPGTMEPGTIPPDNSKDGFISEHVGASAN